MIPEVSKLVQTCPNLSNFVQTCPNLSKFVQTCLNSSKLVQTCLNSSKLVQTCPILTLATSSLVAPNGAQHCCRPRGTSKPRKNRSIFLKKKKKKKKKKKRTVFQRLFFLRSFSPARRPRQTSKIVSKFFLKVLKIHRFFPKKTERRISKKRLKKRLL